MEPNRDTWANRLREYWYKNDDRFGEEEEAISYPKLLKPYLNIGFEEVRINYGGNVAYLLIGQSLAIGLPVRFKQILAPPTFFLERVLKALGLGPQLFFSAAWRKKV